MARSPRRKVVEAEAFLLKDSRGHVRAQLSLTSEGPCLAFYEQDGTPRLILRTARCGESIKSMPGYPGMEAMAPWLDDGAGLLLCNGEGKIQMALSAGRKGPNVKFLSPEGYRRAEVWVQDEFGPLTGIAIYDERENPRVMMRVGSGADVVLSDSKGKIRARVLVDDKGPRVELFDRRGKVVHAVPETSK